MKSPTTTQRTMWVCFFFLLPPICSPSVLAPANTRVTLRHGPVICFCYIDCTLSLSLSCPPFHLPISPPLLHFPFPIHHIHIFFSPWLSIIASAPYCNPSLFRLFSGLFFQSCFLSIIPPPTLSQVKRFLPCFSSNWRMRCMSWLHCCFIRKQLFALSLPPPSCFFSLSLSTSLPHYPAFFPPYLITLVFIYLPVCTALIDANWWMHGRCYKSPKWGTDNGCFLLLLLSENEKKERYHQAYGRRCDIFLNELGGCEKCSDDIITSDVCWWGCIVRLYLRSCAFK